MKMKYPVLILSTVLTITLSIELVLGKSAVCINENSKNLFEGPIKTKVRLVETPMLPAYCGVILSKSSYKFELIDSAGIHLFFPRLISIEFTCPRELGAAFFQKGKVYHFVLQLSPKVPTGKSEIINDSDSIPAYRFISMIGW